MNEENDLPTPRGPHGPHAPDTNLDPDIPRQGETASKGRQWLLVALQALVTLVVASTIIILMRVY